MSAQPHMSADSVAHVFASAVARLRQGDAAAAERACQEVLEAEPGHFEALRMLAMLRFRQGRADAAEALLRRALAQRPDDAAALANLGTAMQAQGRHEEALACYERALASGPGDAGTHFNRGNALRALDRHEAALGCYEDALAIAPDFAQAWNNRGLVLHALKRHAEAVESYRRALDVRPGFAAALNNLGSAQAELGNPEEALRAYMDALALEPGYVDALINQGNTLRQLGRHEAALTSYRQVVALQPEHADAHYNEGLLLLLLGRLRDGWQRYEWRWRVRDFSSIRQRFVQPLWLGGQPLAGRTILLHAEQGFGDTLQFCRYAARVKALGARVLLQVQPELKDLLTGLAGVDQLLAAGEPLPGFDCQCPLLSLPLALGTELDDIPAHAAYLHAPPDKTAHWRDRLRGLPGPRVGVVWSGNRLHANDANRSIALRTVVEGLGGGIRLIALQNEVRREDRPMLDAAEILFVGDELRDFSDTAALVANLDLVISVDTAVAHLAGALGKPVWVLLHAVQDWRWLLEREDSPWYPSARLFRQPARNDWDGVFRRVRTELARLGA